VVFVLVTGFEQALSILSKARRVVVLTGAGMSAESGVPTFRDALTGWWSRYDPYELATPAAFRTNPARVFGWYVARFMAVRAAIPHPGYDALVRLGRHFGGWPIVTQNVDGLHSRAGSRDVTELHGSLARFRCADGGHPFPSELVVALGEGTGEDEVHPPRCPSCGSLIRPDVVWFGEPLPRDAVERAWALAHDAEVMLVVGTSSVVYPAADLPAVTRYAGGAVIEVNPDETALSPHASVILREPAGVTLPRLIRELAID
jgi:NAD-dependent protein deacetylase/lipoamidase